jgi:hypothetical protein
VELVEALELVGVDVELGAVLEVAGVDVAGPVVSPGTEGAVMTVLSEAMNPAGSGGWIRPSAARTPPRGCRDRNVIAVGAGMTIPIRAARRSILWSSDSAATLAWSAWLRLVRAALRSIQRPMLAPSFSTSTWVATIPASSTPSTGIQARPLTRRSSSR